MRRLTLYVCPQCGPGLDQDHAAGCNCEGLPMRPVEVVAVEDAKRAAVDALTGKGQ